MPKPKSSAKGAPGPPRGGFTLRGSWDENGRPDSPLTEFVRGMRGERKATTMTPAEFSERIPSPFLSAFPNLDQWRACEEWADVRCSSSAESSIAYCFASPRGEPRANPEPDEHPCGMAGVVYLSRLSDVAEKINRTCDRVGIGHAYEPRRMTLHRAHGQMVAAGCDDSDEVLRVLLGPLVTEFNAKRRPLAPPPAV
jgi:hypothetical protein